MRKQSLNLDNLGSVLASAKNATKKGHAAFETPFDMARALMVPLTPTRRTICDLQCGHGALLAAAANDTTRDVLGVDIDPTATAWPRGWKPDTEYRIPERTVLHGDLNAAVPLLRDIGWKCDLFTLNPPFSLQWDPQIAQISADEAGGKNLRPSAKSADKPVDSTLATFLIANEFLSTRGEGMMICAGAIVDKVCASEHGRRIWLRATLPNFFPGVRLDAVTVLYFAAGHASDEPLAFDIPTADPEKVAAALVQFARHRPKWVNGKTIAREWECDGSTVPGFKAVAGEWNRLTAQKLNDRNGWNIRLGRDGRLDCWLTPFQQMSGTVPRQLAEELQSLHGQHPNALVVQKATRTALQRAVGGAVWRVEPAVTQAVEAAVRSYHAIRAPFNRLPDVMRLAYLDEEDTIVCQKIFFKDGVRFFQPKQCYRLTTETFEGRKVERRKRVAACEEDVLVTGQELAILITDDGGGVHCFTQFPAAEHDSGRPSADHHHLLSELVAHFEIPKVPDVAALHPHRYRENLRKLEALQAA